MIWKLFVSCILFEGVCLSFFGFESSLSGCALLINVIWEVLAFGLDWGLGSRSHQLVCGATRSGEDLTCFVWRIEWDWMGPWPTQYAGMGPVDVEVCWGTLMPLEETFFYSTCLLTLCVFKVDPASCLNSSSKQELVALALKILSFFSPGSL